MDGATANNFFAAFKHYHKLWWNENAVESPITATQLDSQVDYSYIASRNLLPSLENNVAIRDGGVTLINDSSTSNSNAVWLRASAHSSMESSTCCFDQHDNSTLNYEEVHHLKESRLPEDMSQLVARTAADFSATGNRGATSNIYFEALSLEQQKLLQRP